MKEVWLTQKMNLCVVHLAGISSVGVAVISYSQLRVETTAGCEVKVINISCKCNTYGIQYLQSTILRMLISRKVKFLLMLEAS